MSVSDWVALAGLFAMVATGVTNVRKWVFSKVQSIDLGQPTHNGRLLLTVKFLFFGSIIIVSLALILFILTSLGTSAVQDRITHEKNLPSVSIQNTGTLEKNEAYLGAVVKINPNGQASSFHVIHFEKEVINPVKSLLLFTGGIIFIITLVLFSAIMLIAFILGGVGAAEDRA